MRLLPDDSKPRMAEGGPERSLIDFQDYATSHILSTHFLLEAETFWGISALCTL